MNRHNQFSASLLIINSWIRLCLLFDMEDGIFVAIIISIIKFALHRPSLHWIEKSLEGDSQICLVLKKTTLSRFDVLHHQQTYNRNQLLSNLHFDRISLQFLAVHLSKENGEVCGWCHIQPEKNRSASPSLKDIKKR